jgi:5-methylcytosine-specific restriction endonuclease McrA
MSRKRGRLGKMTRIWIYLEEHGKCALCGLPVVTDDMSIDHRKPRSKGGGNERSNLQLAHRECNRRKGDRE